MPVTEIVAFPLKAGSDIGDPNNPTALVLKDLLNTIKLADGCQQLDFGVQVERPNILQTVTEWSSADDHRKFIAQDHYQPFVERFFSIGDGQQPDLWHADMKPDGAIHRTLAAPVTEIATFFFDGQPPDDYMEKAMQFLQTAEKEQVEGYLAAALGITHEVLEREGVKGKAVVLFIGWSSVDAHMAYRQTQSFKDNIHLLRQGAAKVEMNHVQFLNFVAD